ncbi:MAG: hypothetical protein Tsb0020_22240 [Haliangiales bacterium]
MPSICSQSTKPELTKLALAKVFVITFTTGLNLTLALISSPAAAQALTHQCDGSIQGRPWAENLSQQQRDEADALYQQGTERIQRLQFIQAAEKLRAALALWDHPGIHYNLALALDNLGETLAAYRHISLALRYQGAALHVSECKQAHVMRQRLRRLLAEISIVCSQPGSVVKLGGQPRCRGQDRVSQLVMPGEYELDITGPDYTRRTETIRLERDQSRTFRVQRTPPITNAWLPWLLIGSSTAIGAMGYILHQDARGDFLAYDAAFVDVCGAGCRDDDPDAPTHVLNRARWKQRFAIGSYIAGSSLLATGAVLVYWQQRKTFEVTEQQRGVDITLSPSMSPDSASIHLIGKF